MTVNEKGIYRRGIRARGKPDGIEEFFPIPPEHFGHPDAAKMLHEGILVAPDGTVWRDVQFSRSDVEEAFPMHKA